MPKTQSDSHSLSTVGLNIAGSSGNGTKNCRFLAIVSLYAKIEGVRTRMF